MSARGRWRELARNLALAGASLLVVLVPAELVLRRGLVPVQRPYHFEPGLVIPDPVVGYRLAPDWHGRMMDGWFDEAVDTTAEGLRDAFDPALPDPGVLAIGDSYTFGHGVAIADTWVEQLQARLGVNVINTAVFGYGVTQYLPTLERVAADGHPPRLVLYAMSWNDVPSGELPPDSSTAIDGYLRANPRYAVDGAQRSWRARLDSNRWYLYLTRFTAVGKLVFALGGKLLSAFGVSSDPAFDAALDRRTEATRAVLLRMRDWIEERGGRLAIVHIGDANFAMPEAWADFSRRHDFPRDYARRQLADWCAAQRIAFADAIDALQQHYLDSGRRRESLLLFADAHYNAAGQKVIADVFLRLIEQERLLPE